MSYVYSLSTDFPNGLNPAQLMEEIKLVILTPDINAIDVDSDVVTIIFTTTIPDVNVLNTIITNYVYRNYSIPYIVNDVLKDTIDNKEYSYFGDHEDKIIISKTTQGHYTSIKAAILANNVPNKVFVIYPGTYVEDNPIVLPESTTLISIGSVNNTIIFAQNPTLDLITLNKTCKISGMTLYGAYGTGAHGIYFDASLSGGLGKFSVIGECFIVDCNIAIECNGNGGVGMLDTLYCDKLVIQAQTVALTKGVYCYAGAQFIATTFYVVGIPGYYPVDKAVDCQDDGSKISLITASVWYCSKALYLDNLAEAQISVLNVVGNDYGLIIGPNGISTNIRAGNLSFKNSLIYDIDVQSTNADVEIYSGFLDDSKINNPNNVNITIKYNAEKYGHYYQSTLGDSQIGSPIQPSKLAIGEGLYMNNGICIYSNDNLEIGTWLDHTNDALSATGTGFALFQNVNANNCLYFGSQYDLFGFKINILTATISITPLDDLVWEFCPV